jgi:prepilin-type N-terminal cleavage/methylation domain-containing protein
LNTKFHNHRHQFNHINHSSNCGFTLVELIVSMAIAGVLMVGLSTFFASTFHNLFLAQNENSNTERQYAVNQILADKMSTVKTLIPLIPPDSTSVLTFNQNTKNQLPFSFITKVSVDQDGPTGPGPAKNYLGFKDMLPFNKIIYDGSSTIYGDSGAGKLKTAGGSEVRDIGVENFAGFDKAADGTYYVAVPNEDSILKCDVTSC